MCCQASSPGIFQTDPLPDKVVSHFLYTQNRKGGEKDIEDFRAYLKASDKIFCDRGIYAIKGRFICDTFLRFETIQEDFSKLLSFLELPEVTLPHHKNISRRKRYVDFYDDECTSIIEKTYAPEIEKFGTA